MAIDPVTAMLDIGGKVIDRLWPDPVQAAQAKLELIRLQQSGDLAQIAGQLEINKAEAASANPFTSGWRPFVGWTCGAGFAVQFVPALNRTNRSTSWYLVDPTIVTKLLCDNADTRFVLCPDRS